jgi:hypothetical protein
MSTTIAFRLAVNTIEFTRNFASPMLFETVQSAFDPGAYPRSG